MHLGRLVDELYPPRVIRATFLACSTQLIFRGFREPRKPPRSFLRAISMGSRLGPEIPMHAQILCAIPPEIAMVLESENRLSTDLHSLSSSACPTRQKQAALTKFCAHSCHATSCCPLYPLGPTSIPDCSAALPADHGRLLGSAHRS